MLAENLVNNESFRLTGDSHERQYCENWETEMSDVPCESRQSIRTSDDMLNYVMVMMQMTIPYHWNMSTTTRNNSEMKIRVVLFWQCLYEGDLSYTFSSRMFVCRLKRYRFDRHLRSLRTRRNSNKRLVATYAFSTPCALPVELFGHTERCSVIGFQVKCPNSGRRPLVPQPVKHRRYELRGLRLCMVQILPSSKTSHSRTN